MAPLLLSPVGHTRPCPLECRLCACMRVNECPDDVVWSTEMVWRGVHGVALLFAACAPLIIHTWQQNGVLHWTYQPYATKCLKSYSKMFIKQSRFIFLDRKIKALAPEIRKKDWELVLACTIIFLISMISTYNALQITILKVEDY